ncbi:MAG: protein translocase subunit SecF [Thermoanaerobaculia bacterium]
MQFLTDSRIDFMKYRGTFVWVSLLLLALAVAELFFMTGINLGIDFAGGTQLTVAMRDEVDMEGLRRTLEAAGMREAVLQTYGQAEDRQVLVKTPVVGGSEEGSGTELIAALDGELNGDGGGRLDLNRRGTETLSTVLFEEDPDVRRTVDEDEAREYYSQIAAAIIAERQKRALFTNWEQVDAVTEDSIYEVLQDKAFLGAFHILSNENVGPQIGSELRAKAILAMALSLIGMLLYIWYRFELRFGVGAVVALFHDFLITLGLFALVDYEFNLPTIAAFLTLVGYSVNDTVVIFDRVRENLRRHRRLPLVEVMNLSLNQTLSRTILTSGTTLMVVGSLFFLGGEVIRGFAFVLLIGVIIGTYSSIFVASPFALLWERIFSQEARDRRLASGSRTA